MTEQERKRKKAAKLTNPTPVELPSGSWRCQIMVNGKRISVVDNDPEVAHAKALAMRAGVIEQAELERVRRAGNLTLSQAIDYYIEDRSNVLSPSTIVGYREIQRNRFHDLMGQKISAIDEIALQKAINAEAERVGQKTIKNALGLTVAVVSKYKEISMDNLKLPQRRKKKPKYLDEVGMIDLFEAIKGSPVEVPILLAVWLGLRRSEIMGLCWDCIDFDASKILIERTYVRSEEGGYVRRDEMKTEESRREIECPHYILSKLAAYQPDIKKRTGQVFHIHPNTIYSSLKRICEKNGIDFVGVHGLRHTNASVMLSLGIIDKVAMARGGWSTDVTLKQVYQHLFQSDKKSSDQKVDSFFTSISQGINPNE